MPRFAEIEKLLQRYIVCRESIAHLSIVDGRNSAEDDLYYECEINDVIAISNMIEQNLAAEPPQDNDFELIREIEVFLKPWSTPDCDFLGEPEESDVMISRARKIVQHIQERQQCQESGDSQPNWWSSLNRTEQDILTILKERCLTAAELEREAYVGDRQVKRVLGDLSKDKLIVNMRAVSKFASEENVPKSGYVRVDCLPPELTEVVSAFLSAGERVENE